MFSNYIECYLKKTKPIYKNNHANFINILKETFKADTLGKVTIKYKWKFHI